MSKKPNKNHSNSVRRKFQSFNTGLAEGLSGISFEQLSSFSSGKKDTDLQADQVLDGETNQVNDRRMQKNKQINTPSSNVSTDLAEAFGEMVSMSLNDQPLSKANFVNKDFPVSAGKPSRCFPSLNRTETMLPRNKLYLWSQLPEWDNTKNYVSVRVKKCEYAFPIHCWISVMGLCEEIYKDCDEHLLIRKESRKAIAGVIQSYCDRGVSLDSIDRSLIEKKVRKRLSGIYDLKIILRQKRLQYDNNTKAALESTFQQHSVQATYEERIRAYRARNPNDAKNFTDLVRKKLEDYIAKKSKRVGQQQLRTLPGAFTHKQEDARTVWIGLDYGTKNVKVAFRDGEDDDNSVILELNPSAHGINKYMMSSATLVKGDRIIHRKHEACWSPSWKHALSYYYGETFAKDDAEIRSWLDNCIKQNEVFSKRSTEELVLFFTSIHIAFILGAVKDEIQTYYRERGITDNLAFRVFMCAPVAALDQQLSQLVFMDCLTLADEMHGVLEFSSGDISVQDAFDAYDQASCLGILLKERTKRRSRVVPEVLAEIASFAQSKAAQEGIYALVDVGAGTLDLNVFRIVNFIKDGDVRTPVFAASCHPNGVKHLDSVLAEALGYDLEISEAQFEKQKSLRQFPDINALARSDEKINQTELYSRLKKAHSEYCDDVAKRTRFTWVEAWEKKGLERKEWTQLTMFLCGGGANILNLQKHLEAGMPELIIQRIKHGVLPCPSESEFVRPPGFPEEDFHRVAVAYGLTFGSNLDPYTAPSEIAKVRLCRETFDIESCYISKDMV